MDKIPLKAERVFKGVLFDVYQWQQELYDGSTTLFEKLRRVSSTEVILVDGEDIILAEQEQPGKGRFLSPFGGRIEPGETPLVSAQRELLEESGYEADHWLLMEQSNFPWDKLDWDNYLFIAAGARTVREPKPDGGEKIRLMRCSIDEFLELGRDKIYWKHPAGLYQSIVDPQAKKRLLQLITQARSQPIER